MGEIINGVLRKTARRAHQLQRPAAWAWDREIIDRAEAAGATWTEIHDLDGGRVYRVALSDFRRYCIRVNRGFGEQLALPLPFWQVRRPGEKMVEQLSRFEVRP